MNFDQKLLETAKKDVESSILLFESKFYSQAIFSLQQSIEKCVKSFGLKTNTISEKDLSKKINHLPHKVFSRLYSKKLDELKEKKNFKSLIPEMIPPHQRNQNYDGKIKQLEELYNQINYVQLSDEITIQETQKFIDNANEIDSLQITNEKELYELIKEDYIKTNLHLKSFFSSGENNEQIVRDIEESIANPDVVLQNLLAKEKANFKYRKRVNYISYVWVNLSILTSPHEQSTRYPSEETGKSPNEIYNDEHDLVKVFPELIRLMKNSIDKFEKTYFNDIQN